MNYSRRLSALPPYPFAEMEKVIAEKQRKGEEIISFGIGDPDLPPPKFVLDAMAKALKMPGMHNYSSSEGEKFFRDTVAEWFEQRFNIKINPDTQVCSLIGSKEGLANFTRAILNPGDKILCPNPSYPVYRQAASILNDNIPIEVLLDSKNGFKPSIDEIAQYDFSCMFLNYPNNPTGAVADASYLKKALDLCREKGAYLCYDNAYSEMTYESFKAPSILQIDKNMERSIEFHSCSKTFNMTGYRIGFAVGNEDLIRGLKKVKSQIDSGAPKFVQYAASEALKQYSNGKPPKETRDTIATYEKRLGLLVNGLRKLGYETEMPLGTFYLWVNVDGNSKGFASKLLDYGVAVTPGPAFGSGGEGYIRFSLTVNEKLVKRALEKIELAVR
ncbi:MAG: aminotransferase class I/II-fold pyridoxal phosphate-dependent enzyme [Thaumarchaeota archaeon]|nr:aminotransferase class I/II-fold pyridoxal phosphate-dependent enzyme [Nitrososphaerota archaeon]